MRSWKLGQWNMEVRKYNTEARGGIHEGRSVY